MQKKRIQEIYKTITERLTRRDFLRKTRLTKKAMQSFLKEEHWKQAIKNVIETQSLSCRNILENFKPILQQLCDTEPSIGWFSYIYLYLRKNLFPESVSLEENNNYDILVFVYLEILRIFIEYDRQVREFDPQKDFIFLTEEELLSSHNSDEYQRFKDCYEKQFIYEMMCIGREETDFDSLGHIAGVHAIAMHVARQMAEAGIPIDLALVSGSSAGHDIGKYGCRSAEIKRMPYLHYYYTDQWFKNNDMPAIGHIATNHSTWDLELENLPVESLVLIYADFRVKSNGKRNGREHIEFYSLRDSFHIILNKLDNVDNTKRDRYRHVYAKLVDFQSYMQNLGVNTDLTTSVLEPRIKKDAVLMDLEETIQNLKYLAIDHNIQLMNKLSSEASFASIVESARSEKNWKNSRAYLNIFEEYFTYMTQKQKMITLNFLYELLMHREGDIRRQAADLMGNIIVHYDEEYRKELPENVTRDVNEFTAFQLWEYYLEKIILPDHKVTEQHKRWIGYALKLVVGSVLMRCQKGEETEYLARFLKYYEDWNREDSTAFVLVDCMLLLPVFLLSENQRDCLLKFVQELAKRDSIELHVGVLRFLNYVTETVQKTPKDADRMISILRVLPKEQSVSLQFLAEKIIKNWDLDESLWPYNKTLIYEDAEVVSDIFLENLKAATPWIIKSVNLELLLDRVLVDHETSVLHVATHLSNLIKVSERVTVRHSAGEALLKIAPLLTRDQRNEVAIELTKGLEIGEYQFSKYIPQYLGEFVLYLHPKELDEFVRDLRPLLISTNERVVCVALDTVGIVLQKYNSYRTRFVEEKGVFEERKKQFLGMLLSGLSNYRNSVSQEAFLVIGQYLFGKELLSLKEKKEIFQVLYKKLITLIEGRETTELAFFNNAASLNHIYRFINDYLFYYTRFDIREPYKVAFFPGTFDPFSLGHKGIAREIRDMGFVVYLALDEFSWSKKTQPRMIRRQIMNMSIANEENIYLFPDDIPVNIANPEDLRRLKDLFFAKEIYMVAGSDVVENASSYKLKPVEDSIQTFHHILFLRSSQVEEEETQGMDSPEQKILGNLIQLKLPMHLEDISSTRIRENIDLNRDISNLIDPVAQNYIYENSLYLRESQYKEVIQIKNMRAVVKERIDSELLSELQKCMIDESRKYEFFNTLKQKKSKLLILRDEISNNKIVGAVAFRQVGTSELYGEFKSTKVANYIRENTSGKIILITAVYENPNCLEKELAQILLTETLAYALKRDFTYAVFSPSQCFSIIKYSNVLERQGFYSLKENDTDRMIYVVDMKMPLTLFKNVETVIKEPFRHNQRVLDAINRSHERLQRVLTTLYPGSLVLSFNAEFMHNKIVDLITAANGVPSEPLAVRKLGKNMCVPFGKILKGMIVPNTVSKSLHTEKTFDSQIKKFNITEYPNYSPLVNQIRTIKSFNRPVILVDDILHKGYRIRKLDPIFKQENVEIDRIIVGILSGRGKDLMAIQNRKVESAYFLPSMHSWFVESSIYPFLGGDTVEREEKMQANLLNSVNLILPYVAPSFLMDASKATIYDFSMTCLENAREIMQVLEEEYQMEFERKLTLNRLSEVIVSPCCPDKGGCLSYDYHLRPSVYISNDIEKLIRLRNFIE